MRMVGLVILMLLGAWVPTAGARAESHPLPPCAQAARAGEAGSRAIDFADFSTAHYCDSPTLAGRAPPAVAEPAKSLIAVAAGGCAHVLDWHLAALVRLAASRDKALSCVFHATHRPAYLLTSRLRR